MLVCAAQGSLVSLLLLQDWSGDPGLMSWGADCTGCLAVLGASFPFTAADGREFTVFYIADQQTVPCAGLAVGIFIL